MNANSKTTLGATGYQPVPPLNGRRAASASRQYCVAAGLTLLVALMPATHACATCFGASDSKMAQGMNLGILTLLGVVAVVLAGLAGFVVTLAVRATRAGSEPTQPAPGEPPARS